MARKSRKLSKTEQLRKNIKATIRRREAQGWEFDPMDLITVENGNYQQLKSLQRDNYRKLYEHAQVMNPETGEVITGRQAQIRGRWKGGMWQDQMPEPEPVPEPEEPEESSYDWDDYDFDEEEDTGYDEGLEWGNLVWENIKNMYGAPGVKDVLLTQVEQLIQDLMDKLGERVILKRMGDNAPRLMRLVQLYVMYFDVDTGKTNPRMGDPMILQEIRQLLDPNVSLEDLESYSDMEEEWEDLE